MAGGGSWTSTSGVVSAIRSFSTADIRPVAALALAAACTEHQGDGPGAYDLVTSGGRVIGSETGLDGPWLTLYPDGARQRVWNR